MPSLIQHYHDTRTTATLGLHARRRPPIIRALGIALHPAAATAAWYANDCGPTTLPPIRRAQWAISRALRGANHPTVS